jgi:enoyl-CoA hydratase/carnithine racemase
MADKETPPRTDPAPPILTERQGAALVVTLNRPDKLNAINDDMSAALMVTLDEAEADRSVLAIILQGNEKSFCAGADLSGMSPLPEHRFDNYRARYNQVKMRKMFRQLHTYTKPVISAVEGFCLGGGLELAMFGDIIVAGEAAQFALPEAKHSLIPGAGGTQNLPRRVGAAMAKELMWTGRRISAAEAKEIQLVNHVVPKGEALARAKEIVAQMETSGPLAIMMIKQAVNRGTETPVALGFYQEADLAFMLAFSEDRQEGLKAFAEKRKPNFKGQ